MSSLKYAKRKFRELNYTPKKAVDVLYYNMVTHHKEHQSIISQMISIVEKLQGPGHLAQMKELFGMARKSSEISIDCAHKLAPYQAPKLESIEVKSQVEHKFVIKSPKRVSNVEEWAKLTGADKLNYKHNETKQAKLAPPVPSIHDFDDTEDEELTHKGLLN